MRELYLIQGSGKGYLRDGRYCYSLEGNVLIQGAYIVGEDGATSPKVIEENVPDNLAELQLVFLELSVDPISRVKRGKLYEMTPEAQPSVLYPSSIGGVFQIHPSAESSVQAFRYRPYSLTGVFNPASSFLIFGNSRFLTRWRLLSIDYAVTQEEIYTIQEVNSIGAIPTLNKSKIPQKYYGEIEREYNSLLSELNSSPESVVDHCRDVATSLLSAIVDSAKANREDLGVLIGKLDEKKFTITRNAASIIGRLHPRRKPNEIDKLSLKKLSRYDSDFAVSCIFQIIRENDWQQI